MPPPAAASDKDLSAAAAECDKLLKDVAAGNAAKAIKKAKASAAACAAGAPPALASLRRRCLVFAHVRRATKHLSGEPALVELLEALGAGCAACDAAPADLLARAALAAAAHAFAKALSGCGGDELPGCVQQQVAALERAVLLLDLAPGHAWDVDKPFLGDEEALFDFSVAPTSGWGPFLQFWIRWRVPSPRLALPTRPDPSQAPATARLQPELRRRAVSGRSRKGVKPCLMRMFGPPSAPRLTASPRTLRAVPSHRSQLKADHRLEGDKFRAGMEKRAAKLRPGAVQKQALLKAATAGDDAAPAPAAPATAATKKGGGGAGLGAGGGASAAARRHHAQQAPATGLDKALIVLRDYVNAAAAAASADAPPGPALRAAQPSLSSAAPDAAAAVDCSSLFALSAEEVIDYMMTCPGEAAPAPAPNEAPPPQQPQPPLPPRADGDPPRRWADRAAAGAALGAACEAVTHPWAASAELVFRTRLELRDALMAPINRLLPWLPMWTDGRAFEGPSEGEGGGGGGGASAWRSLHVDTCVSDLEGDVMDAVEACGRRRRGGRSPASHALPSGGESTDSTDAADGAAGSDADTWDARLTCGGPGGGGAAAARRRRRGGAPPPPRAPPPPPAPPGGGDAVARCFDAASRARAELVVRRLAEEPDGCDGGGALDAAALASAALAPPPPPLCQLVGAPTEALPSRRRLAAAGRACPLLGYTSDEGSPPPPRGARRAAKAAPSAASSPSDDAGGGGGGGGSGGGSAASASSSSSESGSSSSDDEPRRGAARDVVRMRVGSRRGVHSTPFFTWGGTHPAVVATSPDAPAHAAAAAAADACGRRAPGGGGGGRALRRAHRSMMCPAPPAWAHLSGRTRPDLAAYGFAVGLCGGAGRAADVAALSRSSHAAPGDETGDGDGAMPLLFSDALADIDAIAAERGEDPMAVACDDYSAGSAAAYYLYRGTSAAMASALENLLRGDGNARHGSATLLESMRYVARNDACVSLRALASSSLLPSRVVAELKRAFATAAVAEDARAAAAASPPQPQPFPGPALARVLSSASAAECFEALPTPAAVAGVARYVAARYERRALRTRAAHAATGDAAHAWSLFEPGGASGAGLPPRGFDVSGYARHVAASRVAQPAEGAALGADAAAWLLRSLWDDGEDMRCGRRPPPSPVC